MSFYPPKVQTRCDSPLNSGLADNENARGTDASFVCGSFVRFSIRIEPETKLVTSAAFQTNGCGYMTAAADILAEAVKQRHLGDLHGLGEGDLRVLVDRSLGSFKQSRQECTDCSIRAIQAAFADYRMRQINDFGGYQALVCSCFGVSRKTIEHTIELNSLITLEEVSNACNAGSGCGSCRMLIQEMLDGSDV